MARYPARVLFAGYLAAILIGGSLLTLPAARQPGAEPIRWLDGVFTAASAVCVTGLTVRSTGQDFTLLGQRFQAISAGPHHEFNDAVSIVVLCDDQAELDRYWNALLQGGGRPQACGWLIDRYGLRWQIVPAVLDELMADPDPARSKRVSDAMLQMIKLDIAALEEAYHS